MSTIRVIYEQAPNFPATDQHPDAQRYTVTVVRGGVAKDYIVDAIGGPPTPAQVLAVLDPTPA